MADVRSAAGVPVLSNFSGVATPSPGTPIVVNTTTGDLYVVATGDIVTKIPSATSLYSLPRAAAAGTVNAITADFSPDLTLTDQTICAVISAGANTTTTPTFAPDGLTARTITARGGLPLFAGDIGPAGFVALLEYNLANTRWELLNPAAPKDIEVTLAEAAPTSMDISLGTIFDLTLTASRTINFTGGTAALDGRKCVLRIKQGGSGSYLVTWGTGSHFGTSFTSITLSTAVNAVDLVGIIYRHAATSYDIAAYSLGY